MRKTKDKRKVWTVMPVLFAVTMMMNLSCGGGSESGGKFKSNPYLGELSDAVAFYSAESDRLKEEMNKEVEKKGEKITMDDLLGLDNKYRATVKANEEKLKELAEKTKEKVIGKEVPFESQDPRVEAVSLIIDDVADYGDVSAKAVVKVKEQTPLQSYTLPLYYKYLDSNGGELYRGQISFITQKSNPTNKPAEPGDEFSNHLSFLFARGLDRNMSDLAKVVLITRDEYNTN